MKLIFSDQKIDYLAIKCIFLLGLNQTASPVSLACGQALLVRNMSRSEVSSTSRPGSKVVLMCQAHLSPSFTSCRQRIQQKILGMARRKEPQFLNGEAPPPPVHQRSSALT